MFLFIEIFFLALLSMILFILYSGGSSSSRNRFRCGLVTGSWAGKERRQYVRFSKNIDVNYIVRKNARPSTGSSTVDISIGGVRLQLDEKLSKGAVLLLKIILPNTARTVEAEGEIVWSEEIACNNTGGKRIFHSGIKFISVKRKSSSALLEYIRSLPRFAEAP